MVLHDDVDKDFVDTDGSEGSFDFLSAVLVCEKSHGTGSGTSMKVPCERFLSMATSEAVIMVAAAIGRARPVQLALQMLAWMLLFVLVIIATVSLSQIKSIKRFGDSYKHESETGKQN